MTRLPTDSRVHTHQPTQILSIASGGGEITVVKTAFYSEPGKIAQAQLARILIGRASCIAGNKMWRKLLDSRHEID